MKETYKDNILLNIIKTCKSGRELLLKIATYELPKGFYAHFQVMMSPIDLLAYFSEEASRSSAISHDYSADNIAVFSLKRQRGLPPVENLIGRFLVTSTNKKGVFLCISIAPSKFWTYGVIWFLKKYIPKIAFLFLKQSEMRHLLLLLSQEIPNSQIRLTKIISKGRILAAGARKGSETDIEWTDIPLDDAFRKAEEENHWFKILHFELLVSEPEGVHIPILGKISKYSSIGCERGIDIVASTLLSEIVKIAQNKYSLLYNRSRENLPQYQTRPLTIEYGTNVFKDQNNKDFFVKTIKQLTDSSCAVYHGNPYIHMSVADYADGSSYDIWVVNPKRITIVPQIRATEGSLSRLINHIFERFKEGNIVGGEFIAK